MTSTKSLRYVEIEFTLYPLSFLSTTKSDKIVFQSKFSLLYPFSFKNINLGDHFMLKSRLRVMNILWLLPLKKPWRMIWIYGNNLSIVCLLLFCFTIFIQIILLWDNEIIFQKIILVSSYTLQKYSTIQYIMYLVIYITWKKGSAKGNN